MNNLDAPRLVLLDLSNNNLKAEDMIKINASKFKKLKQILIFPSLTIEDYFSIMNHFNRDKKEGDERV